MGILEVEDTSFPLRDSAVPVFQPGDIEMVQRHETVPDARAYPVVSPSLADNSLSAKTRYNSLLHDRFEGAWA
jgi:hypothetical protein